MSRTQLMVFRDMRRESSRMIESIIANSRSDLLVWIQLSIVLFHREICVGKKGLNDLKLLKKGDTFIASKLISNNGTRMTRGRKSS